MVKQEPLTGVLNIDKSPDWTSHDVVSRVRRLTGIRQVGHAGTLDPMATGVLVVCLGRATRLIEYLAGRPKVYLATVTLGVTTDTYDATGQLTALAPVPALTPAELDRALDAFRGEIWQTPPMFSALKRDGQALYHRARRGEVVELEPRRVTVHELTLLDFDGVTAQMRIVCSAGTYIRSIAHDLGQALGCGGHLSSLRRTAVGDFQVAQAVTVEQLAAAGDEWRAHLMPADALVAHLDRVVLDGSQAVKLCQGQVVPARPGAVAGPARAYDPADRLLAIVDYDAGRQGWRPLKVIGPCESFTHSPTHL